MQSLDGVEKCCTLIMPIDSLNEKTDLHLKDMMLLIVLFTNRFEDVIYIQANFNYSLTDLKISSTYMEILTGSIGLRPLT